jgi:hypothetical protein
MGCCRLGLAVAATLCIAIAVNHEPARAGSVAAQAMMRAGEPARFGAAQDAPLVSAHFRKTQSFYCYPRNYWWFYRPYTTAQEGFARCMPYFHYLVKPYGRRGPNPDRAIK